MVSASEQLGLGLKSYLKALEVINKNKMGKYFVFPVVINIILAIVLLWSGWGTGEWVSSLFDNNEGGWLGAAGTAVRIVMPLVFFILFIFIGGTIVICIMSPIYTMISEKTDTYITGRTFSSSAMQTAKDIWRTILISLKNTVIQLLLTLGCLVFNLIPVIGNIISIVLIFIINSYFFGYAFMDYTNERLRRNVTQSSKIVKHYKYLAIAIGAVYALSMYVVCGTFIAAFLGGISTVAATIAQIELEKKDASINTIIEKY